MATKIKKHRLWKGRARQLQQKLITTLIQVQNHDLRAAAAMAAGGPPQQFVQSSSYLKGAVSGLLAALQQNMAARG